MGSSPASAESVNFIANAGIGKVDLEWPPTQTDDALGYIMYRYYNLTDSTFSDTLRINQELILDTVFTDFDVIPDTTYRPRVAKPVDIAQMGPGEVTIIREINGTNSIEKIVLMMC